MEFLTYSIKLVVFDLDGVLVDSRPLHFLAFNRALAEIGPQYVLSHAEHSAKYDGRPTTAKLDILCKDKGFPADKRNDVWKLKQKYTFEIIDKEMQPQPRLQGILKELKARGFTVYCASNAIYKTVQLMLMRQGLLEYFDFVISCEDVRRNKPHPSIYMACVDRAGYLPCETLVVEDSPIGRRAALASGCHLCPVSDPTDVSLEKILAHVQKAEEFQHRFNPFVSHIPWLTKGELNILIPMAADYSKQSEQTGFNKPFPLYPVADKPLLQWVLSNLRIVGRVLFLLRRDHDQQFRITEELSNLMPGAEFIFVDEPTDGAACTCLLAKARIDNDLPLVIAGPDQFLEWDVNAFMYNMQTDGVAGGACTFAVADNDEHRDGYSYVTHDEHGFIQRVAEKEQISATGLAGVYYWKHGRDFVSGAEAMIAAGKRVQGQYFIAPVFNEGIAQGKAYKTFAAHRCYKLRSPADVDAFLEKYISPQRLPKGMAPLPPSRVISLRGNVNGSQVSTENNPVVINHLLEQYPALEVMVDVWRSAEGTMHLGREKPMYLIEESWLSTHSSRLVLNCKTMHALDFSLRMRYHCFSGTDKADYVTTSHGYVVRAPLKWLPVTDRTLLLAPEEYFGSSEADYAAAHKVVTSFVAVFLGKTIRI